ncbi:MAG: hypothetical protein KJO69_05750 [Gammaproteobacteria bacterium]|nr:hypothetical protein [Gammaproteobacteria bacterium]
MSKGNTVVPVTQYRNGKAIAKYPSITVASRFTKVQPAHIGKVAAGRRNTAGGFSWKSSKSFTDRFSPRNAGVSMMNKDGQVLATYASAEIASEMSGVALKGITKVITGAGRIAGGYRWASYGDTTTAE